MKKILPSPIAFCLSMLFLAAAAIAFAVVNPEVRLWLRELPTELQAAVSAFAGTVIGLLAIAAAVVYHARSRSDDVASHRLNEAQILAALLHGEIVALAQWLGAQAAAVEKNGSDNRLRSNEVSDGFNLGGFSTRAIYESNAWRLDLLGPDLAAAVAYCHVLFERAEWQHIAALSNSDSRNGGDLLAVEAKLRDTAGYLEAFAAGQPARMSTEERESLFAAPLDNGER